MYVSMCINQAPNGMSMYSRDTASIVGQGGIQKLQKKELGLKISANHQLRQKNVIWDVV